MSPRDRGLRRPHGPLGQDANEQLPWSIVYYQAPDGTMPALEFLDGCPGTIDAQFTAVLDAVAAAPPPRFSAVANGRPCTARWAAGTKSA